MQSGNSQCNRKSSASWKTLILTKIYAISPIVCRITRRFGVLNVCNSPGNDLLADLLPVLVGPALDKPQQAHDLPEVTAAATTELNISNHARTQETKEKQNVRNPTSYKSKEEYSRATP